MSQTLTYLAEGLPVPVAMLRKVFNCDYGLYGEDGIVPPPVRDLIPFDVSLTFRGDRICYRRAS